MIEVKLKNSDYMYKIHDNMKGYTVGKKTLDITDEGKKWKHRLDKPDEFYTYIYEKYAKDIDINYYDYYVNDNTYIYVYMGKIVEIVKNGKSIYLDEYKAYLTWASAVSRIKHYNKVEPLSLDLRNFL